MIIVPECGAEELKWSQLAGSQFTDEGACVGGVHIAFKPLESDTQ